MLITSIIYDGIIKKETLTTKQIRKHNLNECFTFTENKFTNPYLCLYFCVQFSFFFKFVFQYEIEWWKDILSTSDSLKSYISYWYVVKPHFTKIEKWSCPIYC